MAGRDIYTYVVISLFLLAMDFALRGQAGRPRVADAVQSTGFIPGLVSKWGLWPPPVWPWRNGRRFGPCGNHARVPSA